MELLYRFVSRLLIFKKEVNAMSLLSYAKDKFAKMRRAKDASDRAFADLPADAKPGYLMSDGRIYIGALKDGVFYDGKSIGTPVSIKLPAPRR